MKLLLRSFLIGLLALCSSGVFASWVGVFLFRGLAFDHIHVSVSDDKSINEATMLNIWNDTASSRVSMINEMHSSSRFVIFHSNESKEKIVSEWEKKYYSSFQSSRSLTSINCAFATKFILNDVLKLDVKDKMVVARSLFFLWLPNMGHGIPLPDGVIKRLRKNLEQSQTTYYTKNTLKQMSAETLLEKLSAYSGH